MKESHRKGLANHPGPEPCVSNPQKAWKQVRDKGRGEASVGVHARQVLSCVMMIVQDASALVLREGPHRLGIMASRRRVLRSLRP